MSHYAVYLQYILTYGIMFCCFVVLMFSFSEQRTQRSVSVNRPNSPYNSPSAISPVAFIRRSQSENLARSAWAWYTHILNPSSLPTYMISYNIISCYILTVYHDIWYQIIVIISILVRRAHHSTKPSIQYHIISCHIILNPSSLPSYMISVHIISYYSIYHTISLDIHYMRHHIILHIIQSARPRPFYYNYYYYCYHHYY